MTTPRGRALGGLLLGLTITMACGACAATVTPAEAAAPVDLAESHEEATDDQWDESTEVAVSLGDGASAAPEGVSVDGDVVTITAVGDYRLSGSLSDGQLVVDTGDEGVVRLILDGVSIASSTTAPLSVVEAEKVVVILAEGSTNALLDAAGHQFASADVDEPDAALFSTADLTIAGDGSLTVTGSYEDGIAGKDGLVIAGGAITVNAVDDGIRGKDYLIVQGGTLDITSGGDALTSTNDQDASLGYVSIRGGTLDLTAGTDAIDATTHAVIDGGTLTIAAADDAIHAEVRLEVNGGTIDVSRCYEGIEATQIVITDGWIDITAEDDGLNVAGGNDGSALEGGDAGAPRDGPGRGGRGGPGAESPIEGYYVEMSGGTLLVDADGDGFDSNGSASVTGGTIVLNGPTGSGNGAIDVNGDFLLTDAVLAAAGSAGMAETPGASGQPYLHLRFQQELPAGTVLAIRSSDGEDVATFVAAKSFQSFVFSSPLLVSGADYEVLVGGTVSGESTGGLYLGSGTTGGTSVGSVPASGA